MATPHLVAVSDRAPRDLPHRATTSRRPVETRAPANPFADDDIPSWGRIAAWTAVFLATVAYTTWLWSIA